MGKERVSHCAKGVPPGEAQAHAFHYKDQPFRYLTFTVLQLKKKKKLLPAAGFILFSWTECGTFHELRTGAWEDSPRTGEVAVEWVLKRGPAGAPPQPLSASLTAGWRMNGDVGSCFQRFRTDSQLLMWKGACQKRNKRDFPGSPVARTLHFHCRGI